MACRQIKRASVVWIRIQVMACTVRSLARPWHAKEGLLVSHSPIVCDEVLIYMYGTH